VEPLSIGWHAVEATEIKPGQSAVVMGAGPIGLAAVQCLKAKGAKQIIVVDVVTERKNFAKRFGATTIIDPRTEDVVKRCKELCDGQGPEFAFDCAGLASSIDAASLAIRHKGLVVNVAIWERATPFNFNNLVFGEKRVVGGG
jgi:threonine dehydrogenase-like Zn-dependent dehydrogenase